MKKKLLKSFAFVALGVFATSAYAQSESDIQDAVVAEISSNWEKVKGVVEYQSGTGWLFGNQSMNSPYGYIKSPEFPMTTDVELNFHLTFATESERKNYLWMDLGYRYERYVLDDEGNYVYDENGQKKIETVVVEPSLETEGVNQWGLGGHQINLKHTFELPQPDDMIPGGTIMAQFFLKARGHNLINADAFEVYAPELVIDENLETNTNLLALNIGRNIRLRVIRSFQIPKIYSLSLPFAFSQEWADKVFGEGTVVKEFCGVTEDFDEEGDLTSNTTFNFKNTDFDHESSYPYLILPAQDVENPLFEGVVVSGNNHVTTTVNGSEGGAYTFVGSLNKEHYPTGEGSMHILKNGQIWQCTSDDESSFKGVRGYFYYVEAVDNNNPHVLKQDDDSSVRSFNVQMFDDYYTDIKSVETQTTKKAGIFNMAGQKLNVGRAQLQKGFYIIDGAKVYVK